VVAGDDVLEFLGDRGGTDEVQEIMESPRAWSALRMASRERRGRRLELDGAAVMLRVSTSALFHCEIK
jgi:hypothetical protein